MTERGYGWVAGLLFVGGVLVFGFGWMKALLYVTALAVLVGLIFI